MKKLLVITLLFLSYQCRSQGNMITINSTVPSQMTICGVSKVFTITIYNPSPFTLSNDTLKLTMPPGIAYQAGSVTGGSQGNIAVPNAPVFILPNIPTLTSLNISFIASVGCDIMAYTSGGGIIENKIRIDYTANNVQNFDVHTTTSYIVRQPNLSIVNVSNQSYTGNIGDVFARCISITNGGLGELSQFTLTDTHGSGLQITAVNKGTWTNAGILETIVLDGSDFSGIGDGDTLFENGENIIICETVNVLNCISVASTIETYWGCSGQNCQSFTSSANVVFPNLIPNLIVTPNSGNIYAVMNSCIGQATQQELKIENTGLGQATNVHLDIFQSTGAGYQSYLGSSIDETSFTIQIGASPPVTISADSAEITNPLSCMAATAKGRVFLTIPSVNAGEIIYIRWNTYSCCYNVCTGVGQSYFNGWRYAGNYSNVCQSPYVITENWGRVYSQMYGALDNNSSVSTLSTGQTGTFNFIFSNYGNHYSYPVSPSAYWKLVFTLPPCLVYSGNLHILSYNGVDTWIPSSVSTSGNILTAIFSGSAPFGLDHAEVIIDLTVNCSGCSGGAGAVDISAYYVPDASCSCEVAIACQSASISVLCPGVCPEGMAFTYFDIVRTSYGQPDNEPGGGDGIPDGTGSLNFTKIKTNRAMFGDTITATFKGKVITSINHPTWQYCYAYSSVSNGNLLSFLDARLTIYRGGALIATCTNFTSVVSTSGTTRNFLFDLSAPTLIPGGCLPGGFVYMNNDSVVFKPRYKVTVNTGGPILNCYSSNEYYVSDIANPTAAGDKYQCSQYNGNCSVLGYYFTTSGADSYSVKSCDNVIIYQNYYLSIGPCCSNYQGGNLFPYEYRNWAHIDTLTAIVPPGYDYISSQFIEYRTAGTLNYVVSSPTVLSPVNPNSNILVFPVEQYFQGYSGLLPLSDDGFVGTLSVTLKPSCEVTPTISQDISYDWTFEPKSYLTGPGAYPTFISYIQDHIIYQAPVLFLQSSLPSVQAPNNTTSWDISISNTSNVSDGLNTWLSGPAISGLTIIRVYDLDNNVSIPITGSIYRVGTINAATVRNFRITATFTSCFQDSIIVYSGWNCNGGYPTSITDYPCTPKEITLKSTPLVPLLIVNVTGPSSTIQLCDTASYTIEGMNVQLGTAYDLTLTATLPLGVTIIPGSSKFNYPISGPYNGIPDPVFLGGTMWQWDISAINLQLDTSGLKGILEPALNSFNITFKVTTNCGYTSGSVIGFNLKGKSACGLLTGQDVALSSELGITGATAPYNTLINLISTYISPCANNSNMKVVVHNSGPLAFGSVDSVIVQLPPGVSFVAGSFTGIYNAPVSIIPVQYSLNGNSYFIWQLPSGTASGDSSVFSFDYKGDPEVLSCDISEFGAQTISSTNVTCTLTGSSCPISIITGDTTLAVYTYKAYLSLSNGVATSIPNPVAGETVTVNLDIINVGQAILSGANSIIQFYYDANGNGIYNPSDVFIAQDALVVNNNNTVPYSHTFNAPAGQACAIIAIIDTSANPCVCNPSQLLVQPTLISLGNDTALCSGETLVLGSPAVTGYTYSWTPATDLDNTAISNALLTSSNITTAPISTTYILTTDRMGCISKDTIEITVNPVPISNAGADIVTCSVNTPGSIGTPSNTGYAYQWSPTTGLSDATLSNPAVSLVTPGITAYIVATTSFGCVSKDTVVVRVNPLPTATIGGATAICKGATAPKITFTGADGTSPYIFTYTLNGGPNQTVSTTIGDTVSIAAPTTVVGTFIYSLVSAQDASSTTCSQPQNGSATITVTSLPIATIAGTTAVCKNAAAPNITFIGASGTAPYTFSYTINGGANLTVTSNGDSAVVLAPSASVGTFIYALVSVQDGNTCSQVQAGNVTITIDPLPVANFGFEDICLNQGMYFYDSSTVANGAVTAWSWDLGDSSPLDAAQNPVYIYANAGNYNVTLISTTNNGCKDTISKSVVVHPLPAVQFSITPISIGICDDSIVQFNDASTIVAPDILQSWTWNFGDGSPLLISQFVAGGHVYGGIGSYNVQLTVVSDFGCSDSLSKSITINPNPVVNFTGSPASGCEPLCISFSDSSSLAGGSNVHWTWDLGDGSPLSSSQNFEHCYTNDSVFAPNYFTITLTVTSDSGCVSTLSKNNNITVYPNPQADFSVDPETTSVVDPVISIINLSTGANFWNWNFGDLNTSQVSNPTPHRYAADVATYIIALTTTTQYGCVDTAYKTIVIDPDFVFYIPNSFTPNEDGVNDYFFGTGIGIIKYDLWIFDRWGNMVFHGDEVPAANAKWNGKANGGKTESQMDVYVWKVALTDVFSKVHKYIGTVTTVK
ncbi:MAG: PKD domain-containing protein [Bacteroidota bacterium]